VQIISTLRDKSYPQMKKILLIVFSIIAIGAFNSCVKTLEVAPDSSISLTLDTVKLNIGISKQLVSKHYSATELVWASADTSVVNVSATGLLTTKKAGQSVITVSTKTNSVSATCLVIVLSSTNTGSIKQITGTGTDIGIGADSSVFVVGTDDVSGTGGFSISKLVGNTLVKLPECAAIRVAVSPAGVPWVVNKSHLFYRYNGNTWDVLPGTGTDIGIGADGSVFAISDVDHSQTGGFTIMKWNGTNWDTLPECSGIRIAVDQHGTPWVVNKSNIVYRKTATDLWEPIDGVLANDIGIGADGSVYVTGEVNTTQSNGEPPIFKYEASGWVKVPNASGTNIAVAPNGLPWWVDKSNNIFKLTK
jgi:hypothetical protein